MDNEILVCIQFTNGKITHFLSYLTDIFPILQTNYQHGIHMSVDIARYDEKIEALFRIVPSFQKVGKAGYHPGMGTMTAFDDFLGNPHKKYKVVHVAGTNGKGSVSSMIASALMGQGYRVGLYTSPHLVDFRERIKVDGEMITREAVPDFLERCEGFICENDPSFFEITTAMAFDYFASAGVDYAVVECGLGGRLDSTNIVTPVLSVITSIGLDHTDILGDTEEKIAYEKGGIIKPGVPVVVGAVSKAVQKVLSDIAQEREAEVYFTHPMSDEMRKPCYPSGRRGRDPHRRCGRDCFRTHHSSDEDSIIKAFLDEFLPQMDLKGDYQGENLLTVMQSVHVLFPEISDSDLEIVMDSIFHAAKRTGFRGRWEVLSEKPFVVCDIAHNPHGIKPVMEQLKRICKEAVSREKSTRLYMVFGVMGDKDLESISDYLPREAYYFYTAADSPRAMDPEKLSQWMEGHSFKGEVIRGVAEAVGGCLAQASENDLIYIGGSSYVVAEALKLF